MKRDLETLDATSLDLTRILDIPATNQEGKQGVVNVSRMLRPNVRRSERVANIWRQVRGIFISDSLGGFES